MKIKKFLFPLLLISALLGLIFRAFTRRSPVKPASKSSPYDAIDAYVERQMRRLHIPGVSLAVVEGDRIVHLRGFGRARPGGEAPTPQTPFFIGSVTKSFTALAIMQLVEAGVVELDAPVQRYLPSFRVADSQASAQMTVRHLLNHTSGMSTLQGQMILSELEDSPDATERQLRALSSLQLSQPVGSKLQYNNTNYNLLGLIIEAASGESYPDYIQSHIFDPLDMCHSYTSKAEAQKNGLAMGHRYWFGRPIPAPNLSIPLRSLPSGQLISCAEDMAHYLIAHLNGGRFRDVQILSEAGIAELHRGAVAWREMGIDFGSYAMGWVSQEFGKSTIVSHSGIVPDFGAIAALVPEQKKGIVLLYNANHAMIKMALDEFGLGAAQQLAGERPEGTIFGALYLGMYAMLLIPIFQIASLIATLRLLRRWRAKPALRPNLGRTWGQHILLPLLPNLLVSLTLVPMLSKMRGWLRLFMPDFSWLALISGSFSLVWSFLRTKLILQTLQQSPTSNTRMEETNE
ncbi:MAG TPA: serine hydrolase domain-containing protein [Anaerolineales bacterium]|nr:serine hydrolase domain-containing protein [Anaerolineales bacterium]